MSTITDPTGQAERQAPVLQGYGGGEEMPLGGYATLLGIYGAFAAGVLIAAAQHPRRLRRGPRLRDILLLGTATHKVTRIVTRDWVTSPLRAPFTRYEGSLGGGEVREKSRGTGLRRAAGDLLTCPWCTGPWVATAFAAGMLAHAPLTRWIAGLFGVVTISDFLHVAYEAVRKAGR